MFFAKFADVAPDGLVNVIGGGVDALIVPGFPCHFPVLSLVVGLKLLEEECNRPHQVTFTLVAPSGMSGAPISQTAEFIAPASQAGPDERVTACCGFNLTNLIFLHPGAYSVNVAVDGCQIGAASFSVVQDKRTREARS